MGTEVALKLPLEPPPVDPVVEGLKEPVQAYLRRLRFKDPELIEALARECLLAASRRGSQNKQKLLRRALEEAQRRLDQALAQALDLYPEDTASVTAARAALLLAREATDSDDLIRPAPGREGLLVKLKAHLPISVPPEAPSSMPVQSLEFWF